MASKDPYASFASAPHAQLLYLKVMAPAMYVLQSQHSSPAQSRLRHGYQLYIYAY